MNAAKLLELTKDVGCAIFNATDRTVYHLENAIAVGRDNPYRDATDLVQLLKANGWKKVATGSTTWGWSFTVKKGRTKVEVKATLHDVRLSSVK